MREDSILIVLIGNARIHLDSVARHRTNSTTQTQYLCLGTRREALQGMLRPEDRGNHPTPVRTLPCNSVDKFHAFKVVPGPKPPRSYLHQSITCNAADTGPLWVYCDE